MDDSKKNKNDEKVINIGCVNGCCSGKTNKIDAFTESIEEEIRNEDWQAIWKKYGKFVTSVFVILLLSVSVYNMWQKKDLADREAISFQFSNAQSIVMSGDEDKALSAIKAISETNKSGYSVLAKFERASILRNKNDPRALEIYKSIYDDKNVDILLGDLAYVYYVNASLDIMDPKTLDKEIKGMIETLSNEHFANSPWRMIAHESLAFCYIKAGKNDLASATLESLVKMTGIPDNMAERARILMQSVK